MRRAFILSWFLLALIGCAAYVDGPGPPPWDRGPEVGIAFFYDALSPYGDWLWVSPWGWVWTPRGVGPGWRPYTDGRWVWTTLGWTWVSDWDWGWAPFHYGRWAYHDGHGWIWVPDRVWAPAWVAWRSGRGFIGWAPLPPDARWRIGIGLDLGGLDLGFTIVQHGWSFVDERYLTAPRIQRHTAPLSRNAYLLRETRDRTRYEEVDRRVAVRGPDVEEIERQAGPIPRYRIDDVEAPPQRTPVGGGAVRVYRPEPGAEAPERQPRQAPPNQPEEGASPNVPPPVTERESERREARELRQLRDWEQEQRQRLEEAQKQERRRPPDGENAAQIDRRQTQERQTLDKEVARKRQLIENRKQRARANAPAREPGRQEPERKKQERKPPEKKPPGA